MGEGCSRLLARAGFLMSLQSQKLLQGGAWILNIQKNILFPRKLHFHITEVYRIYNRIYNCCLYGEISVSVCAHVTPEFCCCISLCIKMPVGKVIIYRCKHGKTLSMLVILLSFGSKSLLPNHFSQ